MKKLVSKSDLIAMANAEAARIPECEGAELRSWEGGEAILGRGSDRPWEPSEATKEACGRAFDRIIRGLLEKYEVR